MKTNPTVVGLVVDFNSKTGVARVAVLGNHWANLHVGCFASGSTVRGPRVGDIMKVMLQEQRDGLHCISARLVEGVEISNITFTIAPDNPSDFTHTLEGVLPGCNRQHANTLCKVLAGTLSKLSRMAFSVDSTDRMRIEFSAETDEEAEEFAQAVMKEFVSIVDLRLYRNRATFKRILTSDIWEQVQKAVGVAEEKK